MKVRTNRLRRPAGFTLTELLVTIGIIALLASLLMPALAGARRKANQVKCLNDLRQVTMALTMYVSDHNGEYPMRRRAPEAWPLKLLPYYKDPAVLWCPSDRLRAGFNPGNDLTNRVNYRRSYILNAFNDYFRATLSEKDYKRYDLWQWNHGAPESAIRQPSDTIVLGEKKEGSNHFHMDFLQGQSGNDVEQIAQNRHRAGGVTSTDGGSNFGFADGSVRFLKFGQSTTPQNMWAVMDEWRNAPAKAPVPKP